MAKNAKKNNSTRIYYIIGSLVLIALVMISFLKLGPLGIYTDKIVRYLFGNLHVVIYILILIGCILHMFNANSLKLSFTKTLGLNIMFLTFLLLVAAFNSYDLVGFSELSHFISNSSDIFNYKMSASGGFFGVLLYSFFSMLVDVLGVYIIGFVALLVGVLLFFGDSVLKVFKNINMPKFKKKEKVKKVKEEKVKKEFSLFKKREPEYTIGEENIIKVESVIPEKKSKSIFISLPDDKPLLTDKSGQVAMDLEEKKPYQVSGKEYKLPRLSLLDTAVGSRKSSKNSNAAATKGEHLIQVLSEFNIESELVDVHIGPSVTKFEIRPDTSVKVSRINSISDNIKMELAAKSIRIEAPIPGKNTVGIEIPNIENTPVKLYELLRDMPEDAAEKPLLFTLGKDLMGNIIYSDLTKMPHLLVAGATGAGKSVALNAIITTILIRTTPEQVRLLLIDPKKVEFSSFAQAPHLMTEIISEPQKANLALMKVVDIMDERYRLFAAHKVKNIKGYSEYRAANPDENLENLELLVVIIDELADLMMVAGKEVEHSIQRITQLARAAGIHLIVATQRPSADVITGIIKANIPSRISFAVSSGIDSRTILDTSGAEKLLGNGDMLYYPVGYSAPVRLQGVYISDDEVARVTDYVAKQPSPDHFDTFLYSDDDTDANMPALFDDALYDDVKSFVILEQKASTSLIQRSFGIGYNRAARIIDALEAQGVIGPMAGSKPRDVYMSEASDDEVDDEEDIEQ